MFASRSNQRGSVLIPILIALGITFACLSVYFYQIAQIRRLDSGRILITTGMKAYVSSVQALLMSQRALIKTLKSGLNGDLWNCTNNVEYTCTQTTATAAALISENGDDSTPFLSPTAGNGLSQTLGNCTGYPSVACPFRYEITWRAECPAAAASCQSPSIFLEGRLLIANSIAGILSFNPAAYALTLQVK